jgi:hypothetical protein
MNAVAVAAGFSIIAFRNIIAMHHDLTHRLAAA